MCSEVISETLTRELPNAPRNHYDDIENQKKFLEYASKKLNIKDPSDWYNITTTQFREIGGSGLLKKYNFTLSFLLSSLIPNYHWLPWKFHIVPKNFWNHPDNQLRFLQWAAQEFKIKDMSDWYKIKSTVFNLYDFLYINKRIFMTLAVVLFYKNIKALFLFCCRNFFQIIIGYHGNFMGAHVAIGTIKIMKRSLWSGFRKS